MQMRSPTNTKTQSSFTPIQTGILQRKCASCGQHTISGEECEECQKKRSLLQRRSTNQAEPSEVPPIVHKVLRSPGQPINLDARNFMEARFSNDFSRVPVNTVLPIAHNGLIIAPQKNHFEQEADRVTERILKIPEQDFTNQKTGSARADFSQVRIHTGSEAAESAQTIQARAYTLGHDIVFGSGQYMPESTVGKQLLAHELVHVIQQNQAQPNNQSASTVGMAPATVKAHPTRSMIFRTVEEIPVAGILDYERLAEEIHRAIAGLGTDEEAVYGALQRLQHEPKAINQLETTYSNRYGETLEEAIRDDFSGSELEYALQLINRGTSSSTQAIEQVPQTPQEFEASAQRLYRAFRGWGTDEEAIYAVLTPLQRNIGLIHELSTTYHELRNKKENLRERIIDEMSGSERDYALYLLGEERMETTVISMSEATRLFNALSQSTFLTSDDKRAPVPFPYPDEGCTHRAHMMSSIMTQMGYASEKVFAFSRIPAPVGSKPPWKPGLRVETPYSEDVPEGTTPEVEWDSHVAPIIRIRKGSRGTVTEMVIDPSIMSSPDSIDNWMKKMGVDDFTRLTLSELETELRGRDEYPIGWNIVWTTSRHRYSRFQLPFKKLPLTRPTALDAEKEYEPTGRIVMTGYADISRTRKLARDIRLALKSSASDVKAMGNAIVNAIDKADFNTRKNFWDKFPELRKELKKKVNQRDWPRIEAAINAP